LPLYKTVEPETGATVQWYDAAGNVAWRASGLNLPGGGGCHENSVAAARKAAFQYDFMDRLTATTYGDGSPGVSRTYWPDGKEKSNTTAQWTWTMDYNNRRLLTRETYAYPVVAPGETYPISRIYNAYGDQQRMDYWGGISVDYAPNALGQPTRASGFAEAVTWHPNGALAGYTRPGTNPARTFSMQLNARQLPQAWFETGVMNDTFIYDQNGNVTGITDNYSGLNTRSMGYDALDRLTTANGVWGGGSYGYDGLDNLRTSTVGARSLTHQFDPGTQRLTGLAGSQNVSFGYDVQGNITSRSAGSASLGFVFDIGNRMTRAENVPGVGTVQYTYDGNGRRAWAAYPEGRHRGFAYGLDGKLLIVGDTVNGRIADWYIHLGDRQIGQINLRAGAEFVHTDYLGSVVARSTVGGVLEATRTRYEPYGRVSSGFEPVGSGYTGHVNDADTALIQMQQRYYEPLAGRFLSVDPVVTDASTGGGFNRYAYVGNNPYGFTDPTGRSRVGAESSLSQRYEYGDGPAVDPKDKDGKSDAGGTQEERARDAILEKQREIGKRAKDIFRGFEIALEEGLHLAMAVIGLQKVSKIGELTFKTGHYIGRFSSKGLNVSTFEAAVAKDIQATKPNLAIGRSMNVPLIVEGTAIEYRVFRLPNGQLSVGSIFIPK